MREIRSVDEFNQILSTATSEGKVVVIDFFAIWCGPCVRVAPLFEELSFKYSPDDIVFAKVNVDENPDIQLRERVTALPTFKIFKSGICVSSMSGTLII